MKIKVKILSFIILAASAAYMGYAAYHTEALNCGNLLLAAPVSQNEPGREIDALEELNEDKFMLTYETLTNMAAVTGYSSTPVSVKGTNYTYPYVMKLPLISGGFFTQTAQDSGSRDAVLNEKAAFDIYGGINVCGNTIKMAQNTYTVVGVVRDGDADSANVYVPAACLDSLPGAVLFKMDNMGISREYISAELSSYGITDTNYDFFDIAAVAAAVHEKLYVAAAALVCFICFSLLISGLRAFMSLAGEINRLRKDYYIAALIVKNPGTVLRLTGVCAMLAAAAGAILYLAQEVLNIFLRWTDNLSFLQSFGTESFSVKLAPLSEYAIYSNIAFAGYMAALVIMWAARGAHK